MQGFFSVVNHGLQKRWKVLSCVASCHPDSQQEVQRQMFPPGRRQVFTALLHFTFLHSLTSPAPLKSSQAPLLNYTHLCMEFFNYCQLLCEGLNYTLFSAGKQHATWAGKQRVKYFPQGKAEWLGHSAALKEALPFPPRFSTSGHPNGRSEPLWNISHHSCPGTNASPWRLWGLVSGVEPVFERCVILSSWTACF